MRTAPLLIALLITACGSSQQTDAEYDAKMDKELEAQFVKEGKTPAQAKAMVAQYREHMAELDKDPAVAYRVEKKQEELNALRADQCRREPYLNGC